jgi:hypothetical protein
MKTVIRMVCFGLVGGVLGHLGIFFWQSWEFWAVFVPMTVVDWMRN